MNGYKTLSAAFVGLVVQALHQYGIEIADEDGLTTSILTILAFVGVIYGRLRAHRPGPLAPKGD